jgi:hypothetical protein
VLALRLLAKSLSNASFRIEQLLAKLSLWEVIRSAQPHRVRIGDRSHSDTFQTLCEIDHESS